MPASEQAAAAMRFVRDRGRATIAASICPRLSSTFFPSAFDIRIDDGGKLDIRHLTPPHERGGGRGTGAHYGNAKFVHSGG